MSWKPAYAIVGAPYEGSVKQYLRIPDADTLDDTRLASDTEAASRAIDRFTGRQFGRDDAPVERFYTAEYDHTIGRWIVRIDDLMSVATLVVKSAGVVVAGCTPFPFNALAEGRPYQELRFPAGATPSREQGAIGVLERFGWLAIPGTITEATKLQTSRFFKRSDAPFGVAGSPDSGSEMRLLAKVDPDVAVMVADFKRRVYAA